MEKLAKVKKVLKNKLFRKESSLRPFRRKHALLSPLKKAFKKTIMHKKTCSKIILTT